MILFAVVLGLYAIGYAGYYKLCASMMREAAPDVIEAYPRLHRVLIGLLAMIWPVAMYWSLVKEAAK